PPARAPWSPRGPCTRSAPRPPTRERPPRVPRRARRLGQATLLRREPRREALALARERAELRLGHVARLGEARAECQNPRRLGLRVSDLGREPLRAPAELGLALPQLARVPHEVDALGGHPHLLEPRRLGSLALRGEGLAVALECGGERVRRARPLLGEP